MGSPKGLPFFMAVARSHPRCKTENQPRASGFAMVASDTPLGEMPPDACRLPFGMQTRCRTPVGTPYESPFCLSIRKQSASARTCARPASRPLRQRDLSQAAPPVVALCPAGRLFSGRGTWRDLPASGMRDRRPEKSGRTRRYVHFDSASAPSRDLAPMPPFPAGNAAFTGPPSCPGRWC